MEPPGKLVSITFGSSTVLSSDGASIGVGEGAVKEGLEVVLMEQGGQGVIEGDVNNLSASFRLFIKITMSFRCL